MPTDISPQNGVLAQLPPQDLALLQPHLTAVDLELRQRLASSNQPIEHVYFLESGITSLVGNLRRDMPVEIGIIGREGIANLPALMGTDQSPYEYMMQVPGRAQRIEVVAAREAMEKSAALNRAVLQCAYLLLTQTASTVLANARASLSQRLARWLLMARDRVDSDTIPLTHELISYMLGVRRPGVTLAMGDFEHRGIVVGSRGQVTILDRAYLLKESNGFYGTAESELLRIFGGTNARFVA